MSWHIFPTINNVGTISGKECNILAYEPNFLTWQKNLAKSPLDSFVFQGLTLSSPANQTVRIASGFAIIDSFLASNDASIDIASLSFSTTYRIIATLNKDGNGFATSITASATTGSVASNAVLIGQAVVAASPGAVTVTNSTPTPSVAQGSYTGNGAASREIFLGFAPKCVMINAQNASTANQIYGVGIAGNNYGFSFDANAPASSITNSVEKRPELTTYGFIIGASAAPHLNTNSITFNYVAFA